MSAAQSTHQVSSAFDDFYSAYVECALWSSNCENDPDGGPGDPLDKEHGPDDLSPETARRMRADAAEFFLQARELIEEKGPSAAGHDFWLTRNGHGAGFWDGDWPENGDKLTTIAEVFGEVHLYLSDKGTIEFI